MPEKLLRKDSYFGLYSLMAENQRAHIANAVEGTMRFVEFGMGGTTIWFLQNFTEGVQYLSLEHNPAFRELVLDTIASKMPEATRTFTAPEVNTHTLIVRRLKRCNATAGEENPEGLDAYIKHPALGFSSPDTLKPTVYLIDGVARSSCIRHAAEHAADGSLIYIHDHERQWYQEALCHCRLRLEEVIKAPMGHYPPSMGCYRVEGKRAWEGVVD